MGYVPCINKAWLDKLGLPVPQNFTELNQALKAFVDNRMGGAQTIGITHQWQGLDQVASFLGFFGVQSGHVIANGNGQRYHPFLTEGGRRGLEWMQQLYRDRHSGQGIPHGSGILHPSEGVQRHDRHVFRLAGSQ